ncbi:MAG: HAMP domain-containing protein, partial [Anaerolineae bacterium]
MRQLWVQQTLAFSVVIIVVMSTVAILVNRSAVQEFREYITLRDMRGGIGSGREELVAYHQQRGSWEDVESLLADGVYFNADRTGILLGATSDDIGPEEKEKEADVLLTDADGRVVFDSDGELKGEQLSRRELTNAWPIVATADADVDNTNEPIGYLLLFFSYTKPVGDLEQRFLDRVEQVLFIGTALAVVSMLVVGALLSRRLNAPLQRLAAAARAVAAGDLGQRVESGGSIEVAQVGQAFNEMTAALHEAEVLRQNMVADVAHELRTPLSVLQGNLWAILNDAYPLEKAEIARLYDETRLLSRLVEDLRELALADAGQLDLNMQPMDVVQVIRHTVDNFALAAEAQEVRLSAQLPDDLPPAQSDPDRVAQVLRNLLVNALRHTPPEGSVTVTVSSIGDTLEVAVADTGEGIAHDDLPHVFERFWRADPARSRDDGEAALGSG